MTSQTPTMAGAEPSRTGASSARRGGGSSFGEPQRRGGDADLPAVAVLFAEPVQDLLGPLGLAETHQGVHLHVRAPADEQVRR